MLPLTPESPEAERGLEESFNAIRPDINAPDLDNEFASLIAEPEIQPDDIKGDVDNVLLEGLTNGERERVVAAHARMEDCDNSFPGSLSIILCNAARIMSQIFQKNQEVLKDAPQALAKACDKVNLANQQNNTVAEATKRIIAEVRAVSEESKTELTNTRLYCEKMTRISFAIILLATLFTGYVAYLHAVVTTEIGMIQTDRHAITARGAEMLALEKLVIERMQITAENEAFKANWKALQKAVEEQGMTQNLQDMKAKLEANHEDLAERTKILTEKEDKAYEKGGK